MRYVQRRELIEPDDIVRFAIGWSKTRGVPAPIVEGTVLRVEVGLPDQHRRYVFTQAPSGMAAVAAGISAPLVHLKAPIAADIVRALLPGHWHVEQTGTMMTLARLPTARAGLADGYTLKLTEQDGVLAAKIIDPFGAQAARGLLTIIDGVALHDRIIVDEAHRRRGLGKAVMTALGAAAAEHGGRRGILAATEMGRALYTKLGWAARSPWTTAQIPN